MRKHTFHVLDYLNCAALKERGEELLFVIQVVPHHCDISLLIDVTFLVCYFN